MEGAAFFYFFRISRNTISATSAAVKTIGQTEPDTNIFVGSPPPQRMPSPPGKVPSNARRMRVGEQKRYVCSWLRAPRPHPSAPLRSAATFPQGKAFSAAAGIQADRFVRPYAAKTAPLPHERSRFFYFFRTSRNTISATSTAVKTIGQTEPDTNIFVGPSAPPITPTEAIIPHPPRLPRRPSFCPSAPPGAAASSQPRLRRG